MARIRTFHTVRWPARLALAAAGVLGGGILAAFPATASPAAPGAPAAAAASTPNPAPSAAASGPQDRAGHRAATCTKGTGGHLGACAKPLTAAQLPAGAKDNSTMAQPASDLAGLVDTRTWTSGGGNTFPGADVPFGMVQWSPDTMPNNNAGGGYNYGDSQLWGYSLTHVSGPGCGAGGDVPILPMTGGLPSGDPSQATTSFTNKGEIAQAGYYSAQSNGTSPVTSEFAETPHSAMGRFTFPQTTQADFLVKLMASQNGDTATSAQIVGNNEITGSDTSGNFCGETNNDGQVQQYTVHFDIVFDHPFTASRIVTQPGQSSPDSAFLTFDTTSSQVVQAKVGISYVSAANAKQNWQSENPGWDFSSVKSNAQSAWNKLLGEIQVSGGSAAKTQEFYSLLYKDFLQPNITSDVNGQFMGSDEKVDKLASGQQDQYGIYSGWDTYHSLSQLQAMLDPSAAGDQAQSQVNYYAENRLLQQWGYLNLDNYVMVGDPSQSIIADYYAFGARNFDTKTALADMLKQATSVNDVRPGEALEQKYGYLPEDGSYGCCNAHGQVSTLLEYDSEDFALAQFAAAMGDSKDASMLQDRANNWVNTFDSSNGLLTPRLANGDFVGGIGPTTSSHYVEGDAYEYLWNVPNNYAGLFSLLGGNAKVAPKLRQYLSQPDGYGTYAQLTNEFDFGEQNALDYAGDPAGTQQAVNNIRNNMYPPGPSGLPNNDDLGANSSSFVWEMLGMYPENSGSGNLVFSSPGFPHAAISPPNGKTITINAPGAAPNKYYVNSLTINGNAYNKLYVPYSSLASGATLDWDVGTQPTSWGSAPQDAPPSSGPVFSVTGSVSPSSMTLQPGTSQKATLTVDSQSSSSQTVTWTASAASGVTVSPSSGSLTVGPDGTASTPVTITAGSTDGNYPVTFNFSGSAGKILPAPVSVTVAKPGDLGPFYNTIGISNDGQATAADYDSDGFSYSEQALTAAGLAPGATVNSGGVSYTWPNIPAGQQDSIMASGQEIPFSSPAGATKIGFLGSAVNAGNAGASGTVTITYTDGTTSAGTLGMTDWTLGGGGGTPQFGDLVAATTPYRNFEDGSKQQINTYIFSQTVPLTAGKTVASITLPGAVNNGSIGVFAIGTG